MSTRILECEQCFGTNLKDINPEVKETSQQNLVKVKTKCLDCDFEFEYSSKTKSGIRRKILY